MTSEMRHLAHMLEVENKIKLLRMNWFLKNHNDAEKEPNLLKPTSFQTTKLVEEIQAMRTEIRELNSKVEEYQKELNVKNSDKPVDSQPSPPTPETDYLYMYPVPLDVKSQLTSNEDGRNRYLKMRNKLSPEEKYILCPTQNYKYGWNIRNLATSLASPKYGTQQVLKRAMDSVHGITLYQTHPTQRPPNTPFGHLDTDPIIYLKI